MEALGMAGHIIRRLNQISTQIFTTRVREAGFDLTPVQFAALDAIKHHPGVDQARIATLIAYDRATIGGVIDRLVQKGLVARKVSQRDRRAREINLTETGKAMIHDLMPVVRDLQADILSGLPAEERQQFLALAARAANID